MADRESLNDSELLQLCTRGDEWAFSRLYAKHSGSVFRFALHMSGRKEIAEEVTQDVFLALIRRQVQFRSDRGPLDAFLLGIARNKVRAWTRRQENITGLDDMDTRAAVSSGRDTSEEFWRRCELQELREAILALPPRYREAIVLCDLEEKDYTEAAAILDCAVGTVRSRLHRARHLLSAKLHNRLGCSV